MLEYVIKGNCHDMQQKHIIRTVARERGLRELLVHVVGRWFHASHKRDWPPPNSALVRLDSSRGVLSRQDLPGFVQFVISQPRGETLLLH